ncbi:MAG: alkaline phosphatase, partial [Bacteroidales bacterium]|nr:alkaline phosphatase [Bacteroidales bacterium]
LDFDKSVKIALDFYEKHPKETLIIVTTDHETGGMSWGNNITNYDNYTYKLQQQKKSVYFIKDSLASMQNAEKQEFIRKNLGFEINIEEYTQNMQLKNAANSASAMHSKKENYQFSVAELANHLIDSLNTSAGISWATHAHSGAPVGTFAIGVGANKFHGQIDNTEIKPILLKILEL